MQNIQHGSHTMAYIVLCDHSMYKKHIYKEYLGGKPFPAPVELPLTDAQNAKNK